MIPRAVSREFPTGWGWKPTLTKAARKPHKPRAVRTIPADMLAVLVQVLVQDIQSAWGVKRSEAYRLAAKARAAA